MDYITRLRRQLAIRGFFAGFLPVMLVIVTGILSQNIGKLEPLYIIVGMIGVGLISSIIAADYIRKSASQPVEMIEQVVTYVSHDNRDQAMPNLDKLPVARELIHLLSNQIYNLASSPPTKSTKSDSINQSSTQPPSLIDGLATPILGVDSDKVITVANKALAEYIGIPTENMIGQQLYDVVTFSFQGDETLETWLDTAKTTSITATRSWERVRHIIDQDSTKQFDMIASFSSGNSSGTEVMIALFDKTDRYDIDDNEISFVAMAVHELRTPLTIMRGYIEVFEDELGPTLNPELTDFMHKMHASAQQLTSFVSNILNIARIEEDQLSLKLRQEDWSTILKAAIEDLELRAHVHGMHIELDIAKDLPPVAVDRISAHEVVNNLVDNAIKYSDTTGKIIVTSKVNTDGLIETSIQDFGMGIPEAVMSQLFKKFHRSHKSKKHVGGTGLGLYLCKALVSAHGGNIWVRSKEDEGSTFSFTLLPFDQLSKEQVEGEDGIIRGAHGWIKNHSFYRN